MLQCDVVGCRDCGLIQQLPANPRPGRHCCQRCSRVLERNRGGGLDAALASALTTFLLLFPANLLPLLRVDILQATNRSVIASGVAGLWAQHWFSAAFVVGFELIILPFLRFGLLVAVLVGLKFGRPRPWMGPAFRWAEWLDPWALLDVFLLGGLVGYARIAPFLPVNIEAGGWCAIAAAIMTLVTRASLQRHTVWRLIGHGPASEPNEPLALTCSACELPLPASAESRPCPRCRARVWPFRPFSAMRAMALAAAAIAFYPAAYAFPMESSAELTDVKPYTIMTGVQELIHARLWFFALVIFAFSVVTPLMKLFVLAWCSMSVGRRSKRRLRTKTRLYRLVDGIGRWSHIDVFTVTVFLPLMRLPGFLAVIVGWALPAFLAVVVLTMLASAFFDPRALWRPAPAAPAAPA